MDKSDNIKKTLEFLDKGTYTIIKDSTEKFQKEERRN